MEVDKSPTPDEFTILGSSLVKSSGVYRGSNNIEQYLIGGNRNDSEFSVLPRRKKRRPVHMELSKDKPKKLLLIMNIKKDLPFSLAESESFKDFVHFLTDDAPNISRATMRRRLDVMYEKEFQTLKEKLDQNTGKFSITIDEWISGNNFNFLGVALLRQ